MNDRIDIDDPFNIQKWWIVATCFLCIISFVLGMLTSFRIKNYKEAEADKPSIVDVNEETTSEEKDETIPKAIKNQTDPQQISEASKPLTNTNPQRTETPTESPTTSHEETTNTTTYTTPTIPPTIPPTEANDTSPTETTNAEIEQPNTPSETVESPETGETESNVDDYAVELLACAIYSEAGGDAACDDCRRRVGDVILNRVADDRFPDSIYDVLTQPGQYANGVRWPSRANNSGEAHAVERAYRIARELLNGQHSEIYGNGYVWQAGFAQGSSGFWCCGTYFGK